MKAPIAFCLPFSCLLWLNACTKTPDIPALQKQPETRAETLVLGKRLGSTDLKALFRVMNEDGRFDGLATLFDAPTEGDLDEVAVLLNYYLYEHAHDSAGLLQLLSDRVANRGFSQWNQHVQEWGKQTYFAPLVELGAALFNHGQIDPLVARGVLLLDPRLVEVRDRLQAIPTPQKKHDWETFPLPDAAALMTDLGQFLESDERIDEIVRVAEALDRNSFGQAIAMATQHLKGRYDSAIPFEGFAYGMRRLLTTEPQIRNPARSNKLDLLLHFAEKANGGTEGFFATLEREIDKDPMLMHALSEFAKPMVSWSVKRAISKQIGNETFWKTAIKLDAPAQKEIFLRMYRGVRTIRGSHQSPEVAVNPFFSNLATELNAFALSLWLEEFIRAHKESIAALLESGEFSEDALWQLPVKDLKFRLSFVEWEQPGQMGEASFPQREAMKQREFPADTLETLEGYLAKKAVYDFPYAFHSMETTFGGAFEQAVNETNSVLAYTDPKAFLTTLAVFVARPEKGILSTFDSSNIMDSLNSFITSQSLFFLRRMKALAFEDLDLGTLPWEGEGGLKGLLTPFFQNEPQVLKKVEAVLGSLQPIYYFDAPAAEGLPSPFELYHAILHYSRASFVEKGRAQAITELLDFVSRARLAGTRVEVGEHFLEYPGVGGWLLESDVLYRVLDKVSLLQSERELPWLRSEREVILEALHQLLGVSAKHSGLRVWLGALKDLHRDVPTSLEAGIERLLENGTDSLPSLTTLTAPERQWIIDLVYREDHVPLRRFLSRYLDRHSALEAVSSLIELQKDGSIAQALHVLSHVDNDRMHRIATTLAAWNETGELAAFLDTTRQILASIQTAPSQSPPPRATRRITLEKWNR